MGVLLGTVVVCGQAIYDGRWAARSSDGGRVEVRVAKNRIVDGSYSLSQGLSRPCEQGEGFTGVSKQITKGSFTFTATSHTTCGDARLILVGMFKSTGMDGTGIYIPPAGANNPAALTFTWSGSKM